MEREPPIKIANFYKHYPLEEFVTASRRKMLFAKLQLCDLSNGFFYTYILVTSHTCRTEPRHSLADDTPTTGIYPSFIRYIEAKCPWLCPSWSSVTVHNFHCTLKSFPGRAHLKLLPQGSYKLLISHHDH